MYEDRTFIDFIYWFPIFKWVVQAWLHDRIHLPGVRSWWRHHMETFSALLDLCICFVRGIGRSPVNSPHKGQWRGALMFSLICAWINCWVNNREAGDLRRHRAHYDVSVMSPGNGRQATSPICPISPLQLHHIGVIASQTTSNLTVCSPTFSD